MPCSVFHPSIPGYPLPLPCAPTPAWAGLNNAADVAAAKAAGELVPTPKPVTIADGLEARLGDLTWPVVRDLVDGVITVSEEEIVNAMRLCFERMKVRGFAGGGVGTGA